MLISKAGIISKTYRHLNRYRQILAVLIKYGFGDLIDRFNIGQYLDVGFRIISGQKRDRIESMTRAERVRLACEELGPTFIKMGQILSTRPDLIPQEFIQEFTKLQDSIPPFPFEIVRKTISSELKQPMENLFQDFREAPLAAASIGQVHRARLVSGEEVVVKVQRPHIINTIKVDLEILFYLAEIVEKRVEELRPYRPTRTVQEFARILNQEMDYETEANYLERFARQFAGNETIRVPKVFRNISTGKVLTMEYIQGIKVNNLEALREAGLDFKTLALRGAELSLEQVFKYGFFHADPHPGNIFILPGNVITYFDFGMMGIVDRYSRENFADAIYGYVRRDECKMASALLKIVEWEDEPDRRALERDLLEFMEAHLYRPLKEVRLRNLLQDLLLLLSKHKLFLSPDIYLMIKAFSEVEGIGLMLDPDFDMAEIAAPFIKKIKLSKITPSRLLANLADSGEEFVTALSTLPGHLSDFLKLAKQGKVRVVFEHRGLENLVYELDRSTNRLAFALIISALIIGSSFIMTTNVGPFIFGFPIMGVFGYSIAGIFGVWLIISIFRSGKL